MSDDPRFSTYWAAIRADLNKQTVDAVIRLADNEQAALHGRLDQAEARVDQLTDERDALRARVAAASRWANRFAEFLESDCEPFEAVCHGFDITDDGRCSLAADLDNLRAIIRGTR